jgi:hypothetical protein
MHRCTPLVPIINFSVPPGNQCTRAQVVQFRRLLWFGLQMARAPLREVRWLTLDALAQEWALELHRRQDVVLQELRLGVINLPRLERGEGLIPAFPPEADQPNANEYRVDREWVESFAAKNRWPLPRFWFGDRPTGRPQGRPAYRHWDAIEVELQRRIQSGEAESSQVAESNYLSEWAAEQFPRETPPSPNTIRDKNELRPLWDQLLADGN